MEEWRDIKGYEGLYQVSNLGRVKSTKFNKEIIMKQKECRGYKRIGLRKNGEKQKFYSIHRLVAEAFIPNENELPCINHNDENKTNNKVENLEWCSYEYNANYGTRVKRLREANIGGKNPYSKKVICVTTGEEFDCMTDASKKYNANITSIWKCCNNKQKTAGVKNGEKLVWKYL